MQNEVTAWQLDLFAGPSAIVPSVAKPDPLPDPRFWSADVMNKMVDALVSLATDSRRGDNMPESLMDCCTLFSERLRKIEHA